MEFTHFDEKGNARMVDVSEKKITHREATAVGTIRVSREVYDAVAAKKVKKGDVLTVTFEADSENSAFHARCTVKTDGKTGVEMEALTGVMAALLTVYDMCKAIDRRMVISDVHLEEKSGGKSGYFRF